MLIVRSFVLLLLLLAEASCRSTFATVLNFRPGSIRGWRRLFGHIAPIFIERAIANVDTREMASLSVEPTEEPAAQLRVSVFEVRGPRRTPTVMYTRFRYRVSVWLTILSFRLSPSLSAVPLCGRVQIPLVDLPAFYLREMEFRWVHTLVYTPQGLSVDSKAIDGQGLVCARYTDDEYRDVRLRGDQRAYHQAFGRFGVEQIWRDDLLPCRAYLRHVVLAAAGMDVAFGTTWPNKFIHWELKTEPEGDRADGPTKEASTNVSPISISASRVRLPRGDILNSFLDATFLGNRQTTIREYLSGAVGNAIMCTPPPEEFKQRYNG